NQIKDLSVAPTLTTPGVFDDGVNVEFVQKISENKVKIKVHERGSGETLSCGTGACAVAAVMNELTGEKQIEVEVAGGSLTIEFIGDEILMTGPVEFVANGVLTI
ncbi:MAG: diaminopimelate epimerase, partial [Candidatus Nanopelagicales bacterium]